MSFRLLIAGFYINYAIKKLIALKSLAVIMKKLLPTFHLYIVLFFLLLFSVDGNAQCSITTSRNTTGLVCGTSPISSCGGILYIGDGTNAMTLTMTSNLDLSCLGPIRFIIRNAATVDFSSGNYDLKLAEGSSIEIEQGGQLGAASNCSASDLIKIGTVNIASCNGEGGGVLTNFPGLVANGGYSSISATASPTSVCGSGSFTLTAAANPSSEATYKWYTTESGGSPVYAGNPYTTGVISATTTYYVEAVYSGAGGYTTVRKPVTVMVNPLPLAAGTITGTATVCQGLSSVSYTVPAITNATNYTWSYSGSGATITGTTNSPTITFSSNATSGNLTVYGVNACGNGTVSANYPITVNAVPSKPIIGTITHPSCTTSKGSVVLTGLPSGSWVLYQNTSGAQTIYNGTGSTFLVTGLESKTYYFNVDNGSCLSSKSDDVVINVQPGTKTWNGTDWSPSGEPTIENKVMFTGNYNSTANLEACTCEVKNNASVVINSGHTLKVANEVSVENGSLTFENGASLVQVNDAAVNSGSINYKRTTTPILKTDYTYWSSPVRSYALGGITTGTLYYSFNATAGSWVGASSGTTMVAAKGYIVRGPSTYSTTVPQFFTATFAGVPNNGVITTTIGGANTSNLIGNPYPSAIDADAFLTQNSAVLEGTLYFWTHNTSIRLASFLNAGTAGSGDYAYTSDDYAVYNLTGGTSAVSGGTPHSGKIAAGQGFMATGYSTGGTATFKNSMRLGSGGAVLNNAQFFKLTSTSKISSDIEKNRIWLNLTNKQGAFKQTLVGYITGATNNYDRGYDGVSNNGNKYVDFYSVNNNTNLTIQGRALPFETTDEVSLGYVSAIEGEFSVSIDNADGLLKDQNVFLEDKMLDTIHDLRKSAYKFTTFKGTFNDRFVLAYKDKNAPTTEPEILSNTVVLSNKNKELQITSSSEIIDTIFVYDTAGKQLFKKENVNNTVSWISLVSKNQMLLVKTILQNGQVVINKTVY